MHLKREPNVGDFDALYAAVIEAHSDLSESESAALNARLVLLLANHIGDEAVLREAIAGGARVDRSEVRGCHPGMRASAYPGPRNCSIGSIAMTRRTG